MFVYGSLRPGHGNYRRLLEGRTANERPAIAKGLALFGSAIPASPMAVGDIIGHPQQGRHRTDNPAGEHRVTELRDLLGTKFSRQLRDVA